MDAACISSINMTSKVLFFKDSVIFCTLHFKNCVNPNYLSRQQNNSSQLHKNYLSQVEEEISDD